MAATNNRNGEVTYEIKRHIGVIDTLENREERWTKEINIVSWNGGKPKIDIRDWNSRHDRMSRGITLTEEQAEKLGKLLAEMYRNRDRSPIHRDDMER